MKAIILTLALLVSTTLASVADTIEGLSFAAITANMQARGMEVKDLVASDQGKVVFFTATDAEHGLELWITDGTENGTLMIRDIRPGSQSSGVTELVILDGHLFFIADDGTKGGPEPWVSDGTPEGTFPIHDPFRYKMANTHASLN